MPRAAKVPCRHTLCPALLDKPGFCKAHEAERFNGAREHDSRRGSSTQRGYDYRWQKTRKGYLAKHPLCVHCQASGRVVAATEIDHIIPIQIDSNRKYDRENWQSLCKSCHSVKTAKDKIIYANIEI